jgi:hypothetical protein
MALQQRQHVDAVRCRTCFSGMISIFVFDILRIPSWCIKISSACTAPDCTRQAVCLKEDCKKKQASVQSVIFVSAVCRLYYTKLHFAACLVHRSKLVSRRRGTTRCRGKLHNEDPHKSFRHQIFTVIDMADATGRTLQCFTPRF